MYCVECDRYYFAQENVIGREENYEDAMENLSQASKIAVSNRLLNELRRINCLLGVAQGHLHFREYSQQLLSSMSSS